MKSSDSPPAGPILVAVDFSEHSARALVWAARLSRCLHAPVQVLHVVHDPESAPGYYKHSKKWKKHLVRMEEAAADTGYPSLAMYSTPDSSASNSCSRP